MFILAYLFHLFILGGFSVFAGVGERTREGNDLYREMIESGVIKLDDKQVHETHVQYIIAFCMYWINLSYTNVLLQSESKCALVYGQMNEPPGARARVGLTGLTVAEHFRDAEGQDVLLFIDNIFRFTQVPLCQLPVMISLVVGSQLTPANIYAQLSAQLV